MTVKGDKNSNIEYMYDSKFDVLGIRFGKDYNYSESIEITEGVILDFDTENNPVAIEILDAFKILKVPKFSLNNIKSIRLSIVINEELIKINLMLGVIIHNKRKEETINAFTANVQRMPNIDTELATA